MSVDAQAKPHFSATQLNLFHMCGEAYRRRYIEGDRTPPGLHQLRGTGFHRGAAVNMSQKVESFRDLPAREIVDAGVAAYDEQAKGGITLTAEESSVGVGIVAGATRDDLAAMLDVHARAQAPAHQPVVVEELVRLELPGPRDLVGVLDLATETRVVDFKTAKRSKSQDEADKSLQLTVYAAAFAARFGYRPDAVVLDSVVQTKRETKRQILESTRDDADFAALAARINVATKMIEAGLFPPADLGSWKCSERYCEFYRSCPFVNGGRASQGD